MRRTSGNRYLVTILALSLTVVCVSVHLRDASAMTVRKTSSVRWVDTSGSSYGDPDAPGGSGIGTGTLPGGTVITPRTSLTQTSTRTSGEGAAASKMGWGDVIRMLLTQWRVIFAR